MPDHWQFLDADASERAEFADLETTLGKPSQPAAPPNRLRHVLRIDAPDRRTYYLKVFDTTQWKNRWRNRSTAPRSDLDGEREAAIAVALRDRGIATARPIALGRRGAASYYLCAAVDGESVADLRRAGRWDPVDDAALARFCGAIAARGVVLTDLSADHVFRSADGGFAVIDLTNGRLRTRPTVREASRMLRRFAKSVRDLGIPRTRALRFAARLLRAAGLDQRHRAAAIARVPPIDTHGRYDAGARSHRYDQRSRLRSARELKLLQRVWPGRPGDCVLDAPCGAGRLGPFCDDVGARWIPADRSRAMLEQLRARGCDVTPLQCDAACLPLADRATDGVVMFRFLHHLPAAAARSVFDEAMRVADRWVVVTFFHPVSTHNVSRRLRELLRGTARTRFSVTPRTLRAWARVRGFRVLTLRADGAYRRDVWIAAFERVSE